MITRRNAGVRSLRAAPLMGSALLCQAGVLKSLADKSRRDAAAANTGIIADDLGRFSLAAQ
jgi:hypothetical protein